MSFRLEFEQLQAMLWEVASFHLKLDSGCRPPWWRSLVLVISFILFFSQPAEERAVVVVVAIFTIFIVASSSVFSTVAYISKRARGYLSSINIKYVIWTITVDIFIKLTRK